MLNISFSIDPTEYEYTLLMYVQLGFCFTKKCEVDKDKNQISLTVTLDL